MNLKVTLVFALFAFFQFSIIGQSSSGLLLTQGNFQEVIKQLGTDEHGLSNTQRYHLAIAYHKCGYPDKAITCLLRDSASLNKVQKDLLCKAYLTTGNYSKALPICKSIYKANPNEVSNIIRLAEINNHYKSYEANIKLLNDFVINDSTNYSVNLLLAETYQKSKMHVEAMETYSMIMEQYPDNEKIALKLGQLYYNQKKYVKCHDFCVPFIDKIENNKNFLLLAGLANFKNGSYHNVLVMFKRLEVRGDSSFLTKKHLGFTYYRTDNYEKAIDYLHLAMDYKDNDPEVAYFLGASYGKTNQALEGLQYLFLAQDLVKPSPSLMEKSHNKIADIYLDNKNYAFAINHYQNAYKYAPKNAQYLYRQATIYDYDLEDKAKAMALYEAFLTALPDSLNEDTKKGNELYTLKLKEIVNSRLISLKENAFFENGI
ncbi:tetratricopeptide repeat protein [Saccharicrinis aurantiacus]|uniref:tetratricopeptide repeat protein n=1 Tax=Saccharicrinis aurantiacus TaxID=1849719 RepID=UPI00094FCD3F|nr:tetratricopeptide repeat protein [Saccharicrinis aurantiacus]